MVVLCFDAFDFDAENFAIVVNSVVVASSCQIGICNFILLRMNHYLICPVLFASDLNINKVECCQKRFLEEADI